MVIGAFHGCSISLVAIRISVLWAAGAGIKGLQKTGGTNQCNLFRHQRLVYILCKGNIIRRNNKGYHLAIYIAGSSPSWVVNIVPAQIVYTAAGQGFGNCVSAGGGRYHNCIAVKRCVILNALIINPVNFSAGICLAAPDRFIIIGRSKHIYAIHEMCRPACNGFKVSGCRFYRPYRTIVIINKVGIWCGSVFRVV